MQPTLYCLWFHLETLIRMWSVDCSSVLEVGGAGGHPAEWHVLCGQVPYCPDGDAQANQPHCFPKEKQNFTLSENMQNCLLTNPPAQKKPQKTYPKNPPKTAEVVQTVSRSGKLACTTCHTSLWWAYFVTDFSGKKTLSNSPAISFCFGAVTGCVKHFYGQILGQQMQISTKEMLQEFLFSM